jgi:hypothetical protein
MDARVTAPCAEEGMAMGRRHDEKRFSMIE